MQNKARLELADYEAENLAKLQMRFSKGWDQIYSRAEQEANKDRKREKVRRKVLDSQERAFWDVHRPVPACVNTTEVDIMKAYYNDQKQRKTFYNSSPRKNTISTSESSLSIEMTKLNVNNDANISLESIILLKEIEKIKKKLNRHCLKMSKVIFLFCTILYVFMTLILFFFVLYRFSTLVVYITYVIFILFQLQTLNQFNFFLKFVTHKIK